MWSEAKTIDDICDEPGEKGKNEPLGRKNAWEALIYQLVPGSVHRSPHSDVTENLG